MLDVTSSGSVVIWGLDQATASKTAHLSAWRPWPGLSLRSSLSLWVCPSCLSSRVAGLPTRQLRASQKHERRSYQAQKWHSVTSIIFHCRAERQTQIQEEGKKLLNGDSDKESSAFLTHPGRIEQTMAAGMPPNVHSAAN